MLRRSSLLVVVALLLGIAPATGSPRAPVSDRQATDGRPNILVIVTDDQRYEDTLQVMDATVEWFRGGGTSFSQAFATTPLCCPSRASIMTGQYAHNHGVKDNYSVPALDHDSTVQRYLHDAGYRTGLVGKFFNVWPLLENPPYFDRWAICAPCGYGGRPYSIDGLLTKPVQRYSTSYIRNRAVDLLSEFEGEDDRPWYLYVAPFAPHSPAIPAKRFARAPIPEWEQTPAIRELDTSDKPDHVRSGFTASRYARNLRARQLRSLMSVDRMVAVIRRTLEALGEDEDTLAIFLSDNGQLLGDHGVLGKRLPYTESIQIPLMMRWPGHVPTGSVESSLVTTVDIAPTILDAAGIDPEPTRPLDGRPLLARPTRSLLFFEHWSDRYRGFSDWASIRTKEYQYVEYYDVEERSQIVFREYYDLRDDPWQLTNLLADGEDGNDPPVAHLEALIALYDNCVGALCP
ncbi:MAG TPA: sulfatase [Actinomycetota bacterium]|nr:sulfatase [Actinomycetota bacterium]